MLLRPAPPSPTLRARPPRRRCAASPHPRACAEPDPWSSSAQRAPGEDRAPLLCRATALLAALGAVECTALAAGALSGSPAGLCGPGGGACSSVLSSPYASLAGVPLPLLGALAYAAVALLGLAAAAAPPAEAPRLRGALLTAAAVPAGVSAWLLFLLAAVLRAPCPACLASASLALGGAACAAGAQPRPGGLRATAPAAALVALAAALAVALPHADDVALAMGSSSGGFGGGGASAPAELPFAEPDVVSPSPPGAKALASHLSSSGWTLFGAFWCSHCAEQKEMFGAEASAALPYVECFPAGWRQGAQPSGTCAAAALTGFPTWVGPQGQRVEGAQTLGELARRSGFAGPLGE